MSKRKVTTDLRRATSAKLDRPAILRGYPRTNEGTDGEFTLRRTSSGTGLYIKIDGMIIVMFIK